MIENLDCNKLPQCLCCDSDKLKLILDLKSQPLANSYVNDTNSVEEYFPLALNYCTDCTHLQLTHAVDPDLLFKNYLYVSGTTQTLRDYFDYFVGVTEKYFEKRKLTVLDIACNDGSQLDSYKKFNHTTYGIDPATNLYELSSKNHTVVCDYFTEESVSKLNVKFDVIVAQNVFAHNSYPKEFLEICKGHLNNTGKIFIQTSQANMVEYGQFDTIYHEHISFFNLNSIATLAKRAGLYLHDSFKTDIHGTSYVFVLSADQSLDRTQELLATEKSQTPEVVNNFASLSLKVVGDLKNELVKHKDSIIIGYGAAAKGNTLLNFGEIDLDYIIDDNPLKQNLYTPGRKIKIISLDEVEKLANIPIIYVPLSWNFFTEIKNRVKNKYPGPATFIKYFPSLEIIKE
jgi:2-polyprenyl-3-methyl-5-hydroxy-6-metoxy-1,4-benzoquinol methylase